MGNAGRAWIIGVVLAACGSPTHHEDDAAVPPSDAAVDTAPVPSDASAVTPTTQLTPGGGRLAGGIYTMDVELGQPFSQQPTAAAGVKFEPNTAIKP